MPISPANFTSPNPMTGFLYINEPTFKIKNIIRNPNSPEIKLSKILLKILWLFKTAENIDIDKPNKIPMLIIELGIHKK